MTPLKSSAARPVARNFAFRNLKNRGELLFSERCDASRAFRRYVILYARRYLHIEAFPHINIYFSPFCTAGTMRKELELSYELLEPYSSYERS